jgi:hypothetical protein
VPDGVNGGRSLFAVKVERNLFVPPVIASVIVLYPVGCERISLSTDTGMALVPNAAVLK